MPTQGMSRKESLSKKKAERKINFTLEIIKMYHVFRNAQGNLVATHTDGIAPKDLDAHLEIKGWLPGSSWFRSDLDCPMAAIREARDSFYNTP